MGHLLIANKRTRANVLFSWIQRASNWQDNSGSWHYSNASIPTLLQENSGGDKRLCRWTSSLVVTHLWLRGKLGIGRRTCTEQKNRQREEERPGLAEQTGLTFRQQLLALYLTCWHLCQKEIYNVIHFYSKKEVSDLSLGKKKKKILTLTLFLSGYSVQYFFPGIQWPN